MKFGKKPKEDTFYKDLLSTDKSEGQTKVSYTSMIPNSKALRPETFSTKEVCVMGLVFSVIIFAFILLAKLFIFKGL